MKGVILAGGRGTRLYPLTHHTNKHLLPVNHKPMISYPIRTLVQSGVDDIMIIVNRSQASLFSQLLGDGAPYGIRRLTFGYDEHSEGIARSLEIAKEFVGKDNVTLILGDNITNANISTVVRSFVEGAIVFIKQVPDPQRFGVACFDKKERDKLVEIQEKPKHPKTNFAVTGLYIYDTNVFSMISLLTKSNRGEFEITHVNNLYIKQGKLRSVELDGFWFDAGTPESLNAANQHLVTSHYSP